ncbi:hypothetical protein TNCV_4734661 [Trichonephila clavipes]|nr:hypothetical protein TNCV_4734661 [Trichonephila clavipes]
MENKAIGFPEDHVIIGDDAFPLRPDLMKPFSKHGLSDEEKIFNYRTSVPGEFQRMLLAYLPGVFKCSQKQLS